MWDTVTLHDALLWANSIPHGGKWEKHLSIFNNIRKESVELWSEFEVIRVIEASETDIEV